MKIDITIPEHKADTRLDTIVADAVTDCSRSAAARLIANGQIRVNQTCRKPGYRVRKKDQITGHIPDPKSSVIFQAQPMPLSIQYEDDYIIVINKPPGLVVHPAPGHLSDTLVNGLLYHHPEIADTCDDPLRSGIVHRLDKDTSGLILVAKTAKALGFLQREFKYRRVEKRYLALVNGHLQDVQGKIDMPIGRHPVKRKMMAIQPENGKKAVTLWTVKKEFKSTSLVSILLKTGRTHQIRVHFYALGYPLLGDPVYQHRKSRRTKSIAPRQMLHAEFLSFRHPYSGRRIEFRAGLPEDFLLVMSKLE